jgi:hypothetical protein
MDLREVADEWQELLDEEDESGYIPDANDLQKYVDLCAELGITPAEPSTLRWYAENNEPELIADSDFEDYARQLAEDIGAVPSDGSWPVSCIDWERAADELRADYTTITYDGEDYLTR